VEARGGINETMAVGRLMNYVNVPYITAESSMPTSNQISAHTIVPFGSMNFFLGFTTVEESYNKLHIQPGQDAETVVIVGASLTLYIEAAGSYIRDDPAKTFYPLEEEIMGSRYRSILLVRPRSVGVFWWVLFNVFWGEKTALHGV
jgi:hypothetical protein